MRQVIALTLWTGLVMFCLIVFGKLIYGYRYTSATQLTDTTKMARSKQTHFTLVFSTFVMLLLCNVVNCRAIQDKNPFSGLRRDYLSVGLLLITVVF